jgi:Protein of unknown function (DUF3349)
MRNHTRTVSPAVGSAPVPGGQRPTARARIGRMLGAIIEWLRAGYPDDAPSTGHSPLLALNGPLSLSARQTAQIVAKLGEGPTDSIDIEVTITKVPIAHRNPNAHSHSRTTPEYRIPAIARDRGPEETTVGISPNRSVAPIV